MEKYIDDYWTGYCYCPELDMYFAVTRDGHILSSENGYIWELREKLKMEKYLIRITEVKDIVKKRVLVVKESDGKDLWLPISQVERYGGQVWIPQWLADKMGLSDES